jgi:hypothetical protein
MILSVLVCLGFVAWSRAGGRMGERTDGTMEILRTVCLKCMSPSIHFSYLLSFQMARVYSTPHRDRKHSMYCISIRCAPSLYLQLQLPTAQHATCFPSLTNQTHSIMTASSFPLGGTAGGKLQSYETASMKSMGRCLDVRPRVCCRHWGAKQARRNSMLCLYRTKVARHAISVSYYACIGQLTTIADTTPTVQQSNTETSHPCKEL